MRVQQPPELWAVAVEDDGALIRVLGEQIVVGLLRGNELGELILNASNIAVEEDAASEALPEGEYVGLTVLGGGEWPEEIVWVPGYTIEAPDFVNLGIALRQSEAVFAYSRVLDDGGSITVVYPRFPPLRVAR